jgi:hypothetical protein
LAPGLEHINSNYVSKKFFLIVLQFRFRESDLPDVLADQPRLPGQRQLRRRQLHPSKVSMSLNVLSLVTNVAALQHTT